MAGNFVISNNGSPVPYTDDQGNPQPADPAITYTDANGVQYVIQPATAEGFAYPPSNKVTGS